MAWAKATRFTYWSYSGWSTWAQCAYKAFLKQIDKRKEPGNAAMDRGNDIHKDGELYVKKVTNKFPAAFKLFKTELTAYRKAGATAEVSWAFTKDWVRCSGTDWDRAWLRIKVDLHLFDPKTKTLYIRDYKTGKDKAEQDDNAEQMDLYVLGGMLMYPDAEIIDTELWYVDHGTRATATIAVRPGSLKEYKKRWEGKVKPMMNDKNFAKSPSRLCGWCHFRASNGGPCDNG